LLWEIKRIGKTRCIPTVKSRSILANFPIMKNQAKLKVNKNLIKLAISNIVVMPAIFQ